MNNEKVIEIQKMAKSYGSKKVLNNININVFKGDIYGLVGPNGSGKSTSLRILTGLVKPEKGEIKMLGKSILNGDSSIRNRMGILIEKPAVFDYLSGGANLRVFMKYSSLSVSKQKIDMALRLVGLLKFRDLKVEKYSLGMKQRLALSFVLVNNPEIIILDEPFNGLDPNGIREFRTILIHLAKFYGKTIILSSHNLHEVQSLCNRMSILNEGNTVMEGNMNEISSKTKLTYEIQCDDIPLANKVLHRLFPGDLMQLNDKIILKTQRETIPFVMKVLVHWGVNVFEVTPQNQIENIFPDTQKNVI